MSFLSHIGLSALDKATGNVLDKAANAIKDGDVKEFVKHLKSILSGVEDSSKKSAIFSRTPSIRVKKDVRRQVAKVKRRMMREVREDLESLEDQFTDKMAQAMESKIQELVAVEVSERVGFALPDADAMESRIRLVDAEVSKRLDGIDGSGRPDPMGKHKKKPVREAPVISGNVLMPDGEVAAIPHTEDRLDNARLIAAKPLRC